MLAVTAKKADPAVLPARDQ